MSRFSLTLCLLLATTLTCAGAFLHGHYSNRWRLPGILPEAARRLDAVPESFGSWQLTSKKPLDQRTLDMLHAAGYLHRTYEHIDSGQEVNIAVIVGPPGPTSVHIPEICFSSSMYDVQGNRRPLTVTTPTGTTHTFWSLTYRSIDSSTGALRVAYGWNGEGQWVAPESPRFEMRTHQALYKLQLAAQLPIGSDPTDHDPCQEFLTEFLPVLESSLVIQAP